MSTAPESAGTRRPFCSAVSSAGDEPLAATASRVDHWILVEHRGAWGSDPLDAGVLSAEVGEHLRAQLAVLRRPRLLLVKRPARAPQAGIRVVLGSSTPGAERLFELSLDHHDDLLGVDVAGVLAGAGEARAVEGPLYVVCTHGKRDRCCALHGRPLYDALRQEAEPERVWQSTHVGGDRFAGNVVVLPYGIYYGRVDPGEVGRVVDATVRGEVLLASYRGRSVYPFPVQAAESALRESEGLHGIGDLEHVASKRAEDGWRIRFRTRGEEIHEVHVVEVVAEEPVFLTCDSVKPQHAHRWVASKPALIGR